MKPYLPKIVPSQFIDMIPYILTILVLASAIGTGHGGRPRWGCPMRRSRPAGVNRGGWSDGAGFR